MRVALTGVITKLISIYKFYPAIHEDGDLTTIPEILYDAAVLIVKLVTAGQLCKPYPVIKPFL